MTDSAQLQPRVSVVMPVFNTGAALVDAVASVTSQEGAHLELLLIDDGSTDGTADICDELAAQDPRITVVHQANGGVSSARNAGLRRASGDFVMFVDADDHLVPGAVARLTAPMITDGVDLCSFGMTFVYRDGRRELRRDVKSAAPGLLDTRESLRERFFELYEANYWSSSCNKVFDAEFLRRSGVLFDSDMAILEDLQFVLETLRHDPKVAVVAESFYDYYIEASVSPLTKRPAIDYLRSFRKLEKSLVGVSDVLGMTSPAEVGAIWAMVFRSYMIGMEMLFVRPARLRDRMRQLRRHVLDARVAAAARRARPDRRGVALMAWLVHRRAWPAVFAILAMRPRIAAMKDAVRAFARPGRKASIAGR